MNIWSFIRAGRTYRGGVATALVLAISGCAAPAIVGTSPGATPPKLVVLEGKIVDNKEVLIWDRPLAFGPVPENLKTTGDISCMRARIDLEAIGYHPKAMDRNGAPLSGGGYFCGPKPDGSEPSRIAPRLIRAEGALGWDKPRLFGAVPKEVQSRGNAICAQVGKGFEAIGYHPTARDESGKPINGGGFFCAPVTKN